MGDSAQCPRNLTTRTSPAPHNIVPDLQIRPAPTCTTGRHPDLHHFKPTR